MNKFLCFILFTLFALFAFADRGPEILLQVEENLIGSKAPADISAVMKMKIVRGDDVRERVLQAWTKNNPQGDDWRVLKFKSPADVAGIGLLVLAEDQMYIYLPEFKRVRRIASSNKRDAFVNSDFSYEDLSTSGFSSAYQAKLTSEDDQFYFLELTPKPESNKPYSRIEMTVSRAALLPVKLKMYDQSGKLWKECQQNFSRVGKYNIINYFEMSDLLKKSKTILQLEEIKTDSNLDVSIFSERFLKK